MIDFFSSILPAFFSLIAAVIVGWWHFNQRSKDKKADMKFELFKAELAEKSALNNRNIAVVHGEMYDLLHRLDVDRVFIIQPHPENKQLYMSVALEVDKKGISAVRDIFQNVPISDMAGFVKELASNVWIYYDDINKQVSDKKVQSMMFIAGSTQIAIKQLSNVQGAWVGSLVVENITKKEIDDKVWREAMKNSANTIQFILPAII